jgi:hypothetical protein
MRKRRRGVSISFHLNCACVPGKGRLVSHMCRLPTATAVCALSSTYIQSVLSKSLPVALLWFRRLKRGRSLLKLFSSTNPPRFFRVVQNSLVKLSVCCGCRLPLLSWSKQRKMMARRELSAVVTACCVVAVVFCVLTPASAQVSGT